VDFFCVYIQEAHPEDGWQVLMNLDQQIRYKQPKTIEERSEVAQACVLRLKFAMPMLLDAMSNEVDVAYSALPERLYVIGRDGRIAWRSGPGPWGFDVDGWEQAIRAELEAGH
jgi:hypothetical protein